MQKNISYFKRIYRIIRRFKIATSYYNLKYKSIIKWLFTSKEDSNFTYSLQNSNLEYLAHVISIVTNYEFEKCLDIVHEPLQNKELINHILNKIKNNSNEVTDNRIEFGRRLGWYAFARIIKPKIIVETGVDKGLGAVLLCSALKLNNDEGYAGKYIGTDIDNSAGFLLDGEFKKFGKIQYGDSIESLEKIDEKIDLFINDSDHSSLYEEQEYEVIKNKMNQKGIILGDNSHITDKLSKFSAKYNRKFIFFKEEPENHWYPGAGIGISFI